MNRHTSINRVSVPAPDGSANITATGRVPLSPCDECTGSGEVCLAAHHPDDPRADRFAECHHCGGSGEIDEPTFAEFVAPFKRLADGFVRVEL